MRRFLAQVWDSCRSSSIAWSTHVLDVYTNNFGIKTIAQWSAGITLAPRVGGQKLNDRSHLIIDSQFLYFTIYVYEKYLRQAKNCT
jgi:hypothetical protein